MYCECFSYGVLCTPGSCNCFACQNNDDNATLRNSAMEAILERNPNAFRPKADVLKRSDSVQVVHKGCFCRKSNCLKKYVNCFIFFNFSCDYYFKVSICFILSRYCECFQAEIVCGELCRCCDCKNYEGSAQLKKLVGEAVANNTSSSTNHANQMLLKYATITQTINNNLNHANMRNNSRSDSSLYTDISMNNVLDHITPIVLSKHELESTNGINNDSSTVNNSNIYKKRIFDEVSQSNGEEYENQDIGTKRSRNDMEGVECKVESDIEMKGSIGDTAVESSVVFQKNERDIG